MTAARRLFSGALVAALLAGSALSADTASAVARFLRQRTGDDDAASRVVVAEAPEAGLILGYLKGPQWCGSGGCTLFVLHRTTSSFAILGRMTVVQTPIMLLPSRHHGMPDIAVGIRGGAAVMAFDGVRYPGNPTVPPARPLAGPVHGRVLVSDGDVGRPLSG